MEGQALTCSPVTISRIMSRGFTLFVYLSPQLASIMCWCSVLGGIVCSDFGNVPQLSRDVKNSSITCKGFVGAMVLIE